MAKLINTRPNNITEYPNSFKRQGAFPLEADSVFYSYDEAEEYAYSDPVAYVGQPIAVVGENVVYYLIGPDKGLIRFGTRLEIDKLDARISEIEKFFALEEGESLKETLDQLIELQKWIEEHLGDFDSFKNEINENLALEKEAREKKDQELSEAIVNEQARATEVEETLRTAIAKNAGQIESEQSAREEADEGLARDISTERSTRQSQVSELQTALNEEIGRAAAKEAELSQNLTNTTIQIFTTLDARCSQETTAREEAISNLGASFERKLNAEIATRAENDELLLGKLGEEIATREDLTEGLRADLHSESETARNAESELRRDLTTEINTRTTENLTLTANLNNEIGRLNILINSDNNKSVRKIANEELAAQLLSGEADADFETLKQLAAWLEDHPEDVAKINAEIQALYSLIGELPEDYRDVIDYINKLIEREEARADGREKELDQKIDDSVTEVGEAFNALLSDLGTAFAQLGKHIDDADSALTESINQEIARATEKEKALEDALAAETDRANAADDELYTAIETEKNRALAAEAVIEKALKQESGRAQTAEDSLGTQIAAEQERASKKENELDQKIDKKIEDFTKEAEIVAVDLLGLINEIYDVDGGEAKATGLLVEFAEAAQKDIAEEAKRAQAAEAGILTEMDVRVQAITDQDDGAFLRLRNGRGVWESIPYAEDQLF